MTESSICPACLRSLRGEPEPEKPRLVPAGVADVLPEPAAEHSPRRLWAVPDLPTYTEAPLPSDHAGSPITWAPWKPAPVISHFDPSCEWCGDPAHGELTRGRQASSSRIYLARRCTACQLMTAYEQVPGDLQTIAHHKSRAPKDCHR
ncbi:hypothetical protein ACFQ6U_13875 [Streptomyces sp. NPDC056465]|uniref:hypothetical protein n=1 Tax=unclassified Streptomyces TaxID=2593676 RepID=UPI0035E1FE13